MELLDHRKSPDTYLAIESTSIGNVLLSLLGVNYFMCKFLLDGCDTLRYQMMNTSEPFRNLYDSFST